MNGVKEDSPAAGTGRKGRGGFGRPGQRLGLAFQEIGQWQST